MRRAVHYSADPTGDEGAEHLAGPPVYPNLPGFSHTRNILSQTLKQGARKSSTLKYKDGKPVVDDPVVPLSEDTKLHRFNLLAEQERAYEQAKQLQRPPQQPSAQDRDTDIGRDQGRHQSLRVTSKTPGWLLYDKKVLRFLAYSTERIMYSPLEEVRVRRFDMRYFLEDGSLEIIEPQEANSGLPQGVYLHRQKVKLADGSYPTHMSLRVGETLTLFGRKFTLVACEPATRQFYEEEVGVAQPPDQPLPMGKYDETRKAQDAAETAPEKQRTTVPPSQMGEQEDFFEEQRGPAAMFEFYEDRKIQDHLDRKLLRFYCIWDNTKAVFGQKLSFAIHYYLKDDTVEVVELHRRNTGRDPWPLLLSRCKLPRSPNIPTVGGRPLSPRSKKKLNIQYYHWTDMGVGKVVKVYGRELLIYDMDQFTRGWMTEHLGLSPMDLQPIPVDFDGGPKRPPLVVPPNEIGIGTEEDSMQNVLHLIPKRQTRSYTEYMENWNKVLRFSARMVPPAGQTLVGPHDAERRFIVSFFLLDNTVAIYEPKVPNSGIKGGMFLDRVRVKKQGTDTFLSASDFHVGAVVNIFARLFLMTDADTFTLQYMETEPDKFPFASFEKVHNRIASELKAHPQLVNALYQQLSQHDSEGLGYVTRQQLQASFSAVGLPLSAHEAITLVRHLGADQEGVVIRQLLDSLTTSQPPPVPHQPPQPQSQPPQPPQLPGQGQRLADSMYVEAGTDHQGYSQPGVAAAGSAAAASHGGYKQPASHGRYGQFGQEGLPQGAAAQVAGSKAAAATAAPRPAAAASQLREPAPIYAQPPRQEVPQPVVSGMGGERCVAWDARTRTQSPPRAVLPHAAPATNARPATQAAPQYGSKGSGTAAHSAVAQPHGYGTRGSVGPSQGAPGVPPRSGPAVKPTMQSQYEAQHGVVRHMHPAAAEDHLGEDYVPRGEAGHMRSHPGQAVAPGGADHLGENYVPRGGPKQRWAQGQDRRVTHPLAGADHLGENYVPRSAAGHVHSHAGRVPAAGADHLGENYVPRGSVAGHVRAHAGQAVAAAGMDHLGEDYVPRSAAGHVRSHGGRVPAAGADHLGEDYVPKGAPRQQWAHAGNKPAVPAAGADHLGEDYVPYAQRPMHGARVAPGPGADHLGEDYVPRSAGGHRLSHGGRVPAAGADHLGESYVPKGRAPGQQWAHGVRMPGGPGADHLGEDYVPRSAAGHVRAQPGQARDAGGMDHLGEDYVPRGAGAGHVRSHAGQAPAAEGFDHLGEDYVPRSVGGAHGRHAGFAAAGADHLGEGYVPKGAGATHQWAHPRGPAAGADHLSESLVPMGGPKQPWAHARMPPAAGADDIGEDMTPYAAYDAHHMGMAGGAPQHAAPHWYDQPSAASNNKPVTGYTLPAPKVVKDMTRRATQGRSVGGAGGVRSSGGYGGVTVGHYDTVSSDQDHHVGHYEQHHEAVHHYSGIAGHAVQPNYFTVASPKGDYEGHGQGQAARSPGPQDAVRVRVDRAPPPAAAAAGAAAARMIQISEHGAAVGPHSPHGTEEGLRVGDVITLSLRSEARDEQPYGGGPGKQQQANAAVAHGKAARSMTSSFPGWDSTVVGSSWATSSKAAANKSVNDVLRQQHQPASLWQTTNKAPGGIGHAASMRR